MTGVLRVEEKGLTYCKVSLEEQNSNGKRWVGVTSMGIGIPGRTLRFVLQVWAEAGKAHGASPCLDLLFVSTGLVLHVFAFIVLLHS